MPSKAAINNAERNAFRYYGVMNPNDLKAGYIDVIANGDFTHALTLKPNSIRGRAAGPAFQITSTSEKYELGSPHIANAPVTSAQITTRFTDNALRLKLGKFVKHLDSKLLGPRYHVEQKKHLRTTCIAVIEGDDFSGHLHCVLKVHATKITKFETLFQAANESSFVQNEWAKISTGGTLDLKELSNPRGWAGYMVKSLRVNNLSDRILFKN